MNPSNGNKAVQAVILLVNIILVGLFFILVINRTYPILGHDYAYFVTHLLDTDLHYRINGLSIQWFTPSFGGGLPAYANPQHLQFSLIQILTLLFNPWTASLLSIILYISAGITCFYIFAGTALELDWRASLLGGLFFVVTGFYIGHMISGQAGFMAFPLLSGIVLVFFWKKWSDLLSGVVIALMVSSLIYQAGFYTLVIFVLSCSITFPILYLVDSKIISFPALVKRALIALGFIVLISASKLYAVQTFMRHFPREIEIEASRTFLEGIISLIAQLLGTTTLAPWMAVTGQDVNSLPYVLNSIAPYPYSGLWETDNSISPALIGIFFIAALRHLQTRRKINLANLARDKIIALVILFGAVWFSLEYTLATGWLYELVRHLPILKSLHFNFRFMSLFYFPLALCGALILNQWFTNSAPKKANSLFLILSIVTLVSPFSYFLYTADVHYRFFDVRTALTAYQAGRNGETFPVTFVSDQNARDWNIIPLGATTLKPYEPIFGYRLEAFTPKIHPGAVFVVTDGFFNMTNPASFTFPETNGGAPFSLFTLADQEKLETFAGRRQPDWDIPKTHIAINIISLISFLAALTIIFLNTSFITRSLQKP